MYALVCKRSKQVCYNVDSKVILGQTVTPQRSCSRAWFESGKDVGSTETYANVAQSAERKPFKLVVVGSSPTVGILNLTKTQ